MYNAGCEAVIIMTTADENKVYGAWAPFGDSVNPMQACAESLMLEDLI